MYYSRIGKARSAFVQLSHEKGQRGANHQAAAKPVASFILLISWSQRHLDFPVFEQATKGRWRQTILGFSTQPTGLWLELVKLVYLNSRIGRSDSGVAQLVHIPARMGGAAPP